MALGVAGARPAAVVDSIERAVNAAAAADVAVVVVGTSSAVESEGFDRTSLALGGEQDELIRQVVKANPRTVVVVNAGGTVLMPWLDDVGAALQCWFGGQEMAAAVVDVLTGAAEPGGRMPISVPVRIEHTPAFGNFPGDAGEVRYGEGLLVGYRWYDSRHLPTAVPFGHGLSFTSFDWTSPRLSASSIALGESVEVEVDVTNVGRPARHRRRSVLRRGAAFTTFPGAPRSCAGSPRFDSRPASTDGQHPTRPPAASATGTQATTIRRRSSSACRPLRSPGCWPHPSSHGAGRSSPGAIASTSLIRPSAPPTSSISCSTLDEPTAGAGP